jgi:hypothetical protein
VLDEDVPGSLQVSDQSLDIPRFQLNPPVGNVTYEDNRDGTVTVAAAGSFVPGVNGTVLDPSECGSDCRRFS